MKKHKANTTSHFTYEIKRPYEPLWKTTWSGSSLAHLTRRLRKRASRISEGAGAVGEKTPRSRISFLLLHPTQTFYFISKSHKTNCKGLKKNPQAGQIPRMHLPAAMGPEDSAVDLRSEPCCGGFCSWKKSSSGITRASVATNCRPAGRRERGQLQRQLCALRRLKPEGRLRSQWRVLGNHKAGRSYSERKVSEEEHDQSTSCKQVLSKVPFQEGSSELRTFFSPVQIKASTNGHP